MILSQAKLKSIIEKVFDLQSDLGELPKLSGYFKSFQNFFSQKQPCL